MRLVFFSTALLLAVLVTFSTANPIEQQSLTEDSSNSEIETLAVPALNENANTEQQSEPLADNQEQASPVDTLESSADKTESQQQQSESLTGNQEQVYEKPVETETAAISDKQLIEELINQEEASVDSVETSEIPEIETVEQLAPSETVSVTQEDKSPAVAEIVEAVSDFAAEIEASSSNLDDTKVQVDSSKFENENGDKSAIDEESTDESLEMLSQKQAKRQRAASSSSVIDSSSNRDDGFWAAEGVNVQKEAPYSPLPADEPKTFSEQGVKNNDKSVPKSVSLEDRLAKLEEAKKSSESQEEEQEKILNAFRQETDDLKAEIAGLKARVEDLENNASNFEHLTDWVEGAKNSVVGRYEKLEKLVLGNGLKREDTRLVGKELAKFSMVPSADDCFDKCKVRSDCAAAAYAYEWLDNCYLFARGNYKKVGGAEKQWKSFVKYFYENDEKIL
jgi:hypothetical protein